MSTAGAGVAAAALRLARQTLGEDHVFEERLTLLFPTLLSHVEHLYGPDRCDQVVAGIVGLAAQGRRDRSHDLRALDDTRYADRSWFASHRTMGAVCYVDRFAGTLRGMVDRLPYLEQLGLSYLHLMPPYLVPDGGGDGGYAVSDYREVRPDLGTIDDLRDLLTALRERGISPALDVVFNHTADDHPWARAAAGGDERYEDFYLIFPDREMPDRFERTLREIFPQVRRGSFTEVPGVGWVWTTFHDYQWDLDYSNPEVLVAMLGEMIFLANLGAEVLRMDAVPFVWKEEGTPSENLPEVHAIMRLLNAAMRLAAPAVAFKSEAIVHPDDVLSYVGPEECEISYNPVLMVEGWEALATGSTLLMRRTLRMRQGNPPGTAWVNYVRSHDDIGWGFANEDAEAVGIDPVEHRLFLNRFYTGEEEGSFARGLPFQFNPENLDMRISGTTASLAGLEIALEKGDERLVDLAVRRILLLHGIAMAVGGIPVIYLGDEVATLNDASYADDPQRCGDTREAHRGSFEWERAGRGAVPGTVEHRVFEGLRWQIEHRKQHPAFGAEATTEVIDVSDPAVLAVVKESGDDRVLVVANFSAEERAVDDLPGGEPITLGSYGLAWF